MEEPDDLIEELAEEIIFEETGAFLPLAGITDEPKDLRF